MKATIIFTILLLINGCKKENYFKEVISNKKVSLSLARSFNKEQLVLNIPLEFNLFLNKKKLKMLEYVLELTKKD
ncbi:hypothetical protein WFZ85_12420 [Flavobacterium sp. j3]|uniref:Lipoprotein n=1 Tax=Flavobacterium aureirubrum TaxID=3133147 RepID=A0ABU9N968_9FLAO